MREWEGRVEVVYEDSTWTNCAITMWNGTLYGDVEVPWTGSWIVLTLCRHSNHIRKLICETLCGKNKRTYR